MAGQLPPYNISQSIRFNSADSAYMHRTPSSSGNRKTFTSSCWVKLGDALDSSFSCALPMPTVAQTASYGMYLSGNDIQIFIYYTGSAWQGQLYTNRKFRDPSAWFHFVLVVDTTQAVPTERVRFYINGTRETDWQIENYPNQNQDTDWNNSGEKMGIGVNANGFGGSFGEYYAAEMVYIDGTAYGPENFGETNSSGIWVPKDVSGLSFGTNGFHIDGRDASDLGDDESGQGNDFTVVNLASHDQVLDSPTNNFAVMNPVDADGLGSNELTGGNLQVKNINRIRSSIPFPTSGKWYWEICTVSNGGQVNWNYGMVYFKDQAEPLLTNVDFIRLNWYHGSNFSSSSNWTDGDFWTNSNNPSAGDIYGFAWDSNTKKVWLAKNNTYFGSGNPAGNSGTPWGSGGTAGVEYGIAMYSTQNFIHTINFGQDDSFNGAKTSGSASASDDNGNGRFFYAPPTGFLSLCTKNLGAE
tara:strand:+ start:1020 stop:2426 length:1407 start_codon:yes stop_codon:yes gene_type:complete